MAEKDVHREPVLFVIDSLERFWNMFLMRLIRETMRTLSLPPLLTHSGIAFMKKAKKIYIVKININ